MSQEPAHFATEPIETLVPNTIRTLTVDAVQKATGRTLAIDLQGSTQSVTINNSSTGAIEGDIILQSQVRELAAFLEPELANRATLDEQIAYATMIAPKLTIQGGTTEILRGIIARGLGLR